MKLGTVATLASIVGMAIAHFLYQAISGAPDWNAAIERTYFATSGMALMWLSVRSEFK